MTRPTGNPTLYEYDDVPTELWAELREFYTATFTTIDTLAAARHLLDDSEFNAVLSNKWITKHVVRNPVGEVCGMSAVTNYLAEWPLISPRYFARHWPTEYAEDRIWYVGFVGVKADVAPADTFSALLGVTSAPARSNGGGLVFMDFCAYNSDARRLPMVSELMMRRIDASTRVEQVDRQEFWKFEFAGRVA